MPARAAALSIAAAAFATVAAAGPAAATSGFGCYRVNTGPADPLAVRSEPREKAAAVATLSWEDQPILALEAASLRGEGKQPSLFEVWQAEFEVCTPGNLPVGARWCPVMLFSGDEVVRGWAKRRFLDHSECP
jgi:hypothetical protein